MEELEVYKCRIISPLPILREKVRRQNIGPLPGLGVRPLPRERSVLCDAFALPLADATGLRFSVLSLAGAAVLWFL